MDDNTDLLTETLELFAKRPANVSLRAISEASGVNFHWLGKFAQGKFDDPGVKKIQKLHDYLISVAGDWGQAAA